MRSLWDDTCPRHHFNDGTWWDHRDHLGNQKGHLHRTPTLWHSRFQKASLMSSKTSSYWKTSASWILVQGRGIPIRKLFVGVVSHAVLTFSPQGPRAIKHNKTPSSTSTLRLTVGSSVIMASACFCALVAGDFGIGHAPQTCAEPEQKTKRGGLHWQSLEEYQHHSIFT